MARPYTVTLTYLDHVSSSEYTDNMYLPANSADHALAQAKQYLPEPQNRTILSIVVLAAPRI